MPVILVLRRQVFQSLRCRSLYQSLALVRPHRDCNASAQRAGGGSDGRLAQSHYQQGHPGHEQDACRDG
jgi:hypothetical protein